MTLAVIPRAFRPAKVAVSVMMSATPVARKVRVLAVALDAEFFVMIGAPTTVHEHHLRSMAVDYRLFEDASIVLACRSNCSLVAAQGLAAGGIES